jgi:6-pyruvoyltetrahydropterin/6-carboxytetrahydropterin synthase
MLLSKSFTFHAAHRLIDYDGECANLHGHTYRLVVTVEGPVAKNGLTLDFVDLKRLVEEKVVRRLDHTSLNDLLRQPSAENLAVWIWGELKEALPASVPVRLKELEVHETPTSFVTYRGD